MTIHLQTFSRRVLLGFAFAAILVFPLVACGDDDDDSGSSAEGDIVISDVWARPVQLLDEETDSDGTAEEHEHDMDGDATETDGGMDMGIGGVLSAVYMTIENEGNEDDVLVSASTDVAAVVEIHSTTMTDGVMQMRQVEGGIEIPAGESETVVLEPGGLHIMLIDLNQALEVGDTFDVELEFENAGSMTVEVEVREP